MKARKKREERNKHRNSVWCIWIYFRFLNEKIVDYCPYVIILSMFAIIISWLGSWYHDKSAIYKKSRKTRLYEFSDILCDHWCFSLHFYTLLVHYNSRYICFQEI